MMMDYSILKVIAFFFLHETVFENVRLFLIMFIQIIFMCKVGYRIYHYMSEKLSSGT